jgi:uncharacterized protein YjbI with pentapeptide repeats
MTDRNNKSEFPTINNLNSHNSDNNKNIPQENPSHDHDSNLQSNEMEEKNKSLLIPAKQLTYIKKAEISYSTIILIALFSAILGLWFHISWLGFLSALLAFSISLFQVIPSIKIWINNFLTSKERRTIISFIGLVLAIAILSKYLGIYHNITLWLTQFKYDEFGSWAEWVGALGQILIAMLAVYVAWQQYVISKDLTIQQNRITQQQTIDTYFQGVSDLVLGQDGLLEDWPQERAIAEGRTAAILTSVDATGKAKILRFLSRSRLLTPLKRDSHLGRPILDGCGGYAEDRAYGMRVINIGVVLAGTNLTDQDLRWTDLSEINMVRADLSKCDLVKTNLSRTVLYEANLTEANLKGVLFFYGSHFTASPRNKITTPDYETGEASGVVIEKANLTGVKNLSEENRYYCCCWGGEYTRSTIPGGCAGIPNKLEDKDKATV